MKRFLKGLTKSLLVRAIGAFATLGITSWLARSVGVEFLGLYTFAIVTTEGLILCSHFGVGPRIIKEFGRVHNHEGLATSCQNLSNKALLRSGPITFLAILGVLVLSGYNDTFSAYVWEMSALLIVMPIVARDALTSYFLNASGQVWQSLVTKNVGFGAVFVVLLAIFSLIWDEMKPSSIVCSYFIVRVLLSFSVDRLFVKDEIIALSRRIPVLRVSFPSFGDESQKWFFLAQSMEFLARNAVYVFLGFFGSFDEVGTMTVLMRICLPVEVLYLIIQKQSVSHISHLLGKGDRANIKTLFVRIGFLGLACSLIYGFVALTFATELLAFFNLSGVEDYSVYLRIILLGFMLNAVTSVSGPLLQMGGRERAKFIIGFCAFLLQIFFCSTYMLFETGLFGICLALTSGIMLKAILEFTLAMNFISKP